VNFAPLALDELRGQVASGAVDTVLVGLTDMQGRLQGKRLHAQYFLDVVLEHATEGCNYLLAVDVDMNTVDGYAMSSWSSGYGDLVMQPDLSTLRPIPWQEGTVLVLADLRWEDGSEVVASPRQILARQTARLGAAGMRAYVGTELEFLLFRDTYEQAWAAAYRGLTPANQYNVDYSLLGTALVEPLLRRIRNDMTGAGLTVESAKGECNLGQHEIAFRYDEAMRACDGHVVYKNGAKEIAAQDGVALTFMAKYDEREGNSCHIHCSFRSADGSLVLAEGEGMSAAGQSFVAGQLAYLRELTLLLAPNINSYKRYVEGSFAPTALRWGATTGRAPSACSGTGPPYGWRTECPAATSTPTSLPQPSSQPGWPASSRSSSWSRPSRATPTPTPTRSASLPAWPRPSSYGATAPSPGARSATTSWSTTPTWRPSRSRLLVAPSPTGSAFEGSSGCDVDL